MHTHMHTRDIPRQLTCVKYFENIFGIPAINYPENRYESYQYNYSHI